MATDRIINQTQGDEIITALTAIKNAINNQPVPTGVEDTVAAAFDSGTSYAVGDFCIYNGMLYKCTTAHHGNWDGSDFTLTTMGAQVTSLNQALSNKQNSKALKATATANQSFANQLTYLRTAYNALTDDEKRNAVIDIDGTLYISVNVTGAFTYVASATTNANVQTLNIISSTYWVVTMTTSGNTIADYKNNTASKPMKLYA